MLFEQDHFLKGINMQVDNKAFSNSAEEARSLEKMSALEAAIYCHRIIFKCWPVKKIPLFQRKNWVLLSGAVIFTVFEPM